MTSHYRRRSTAANKGIAASRARCYLRLQVTISFGLGRTSIIGLLFVIFYFYNFIHQRLGADTAMNSLPAAILNVMCNKTADSIFRHLSTVEDT